ncbi:MAG: polyhydroxyalkanoic acid system family protein [Thiohalocapsa sp.]
MTGGVEPLTVTVSHSLGRDEAKRRIENGLAAIRGEVAQYVKTLDTQWQDYRLDFRASLLLQTITGRIEVYEEFIRIEIALPRLLHLVGKTIAGRIEQRGNALLQPPKP